MAKVRDLRDFYKSSSRSCNGKSPEKVPTFLTSASGTVNGAEINAINKEMKAFVQPKTKKKYSSVPSNIKNEVGEYALLNGTKSALEKFKKKDPKYTFFRTSVNNWKKKRFRRTKITLFHLLYTRRKVGQTSYQTNLCLK